MNRFSYSITTHFIHSNKDYHPCYNPHSVYQTCPNEYWCPLKFIYYMKCFSFDSKYLLGGENKTLDNWKYLVSLFSTKKDR